MKNPFSQLRLRTRLALVMFVTMASTCVILIITYMRQQERVTAYVNGITQDLLAISQVAHLQVPPNSDPKQILQTYTDALMSAKLKVDAASPSGEIQASTDPHQLHKKIKIKGQIKVKESQPPTPMQISAKLPDIDVDPNTATSTYQVQFPVVYNNKLIGYMVLHGVADQVDDLLRHGYMIRFLSILATMLAGLFAVVYLAFRFTEPVDMLVGGADRVAHGNLNISLPVHGTDEMGRLAETFNRMVERLREGRELQERLNEAEKSSLLGRFAATVAHEVRNSLNFINLSIDQIRAKHAAGNERAARDLERNLGNIKDEIVRLNGLVNEFLSAGRQAPPALAPCDLKPTLEGAVALVEKQAHAQGIRVHVSIPGGLPVLEADAAQLKTCFLNVLTNAIQAMPDGGEINVSARSMTESGVINGSPGLVRLRFSDTGPGVPPAEREKIFTPFFSTKATGFGLGLAITKKIIDDHGGRIYVGEPNGAGTVIVIELPIPGPAVHAPPPISTPSLA